MVFVETPIFCRRVQEYLDDDEYAELQTFLAERPDAGNVIKGSGGMRKLRWAGSGRGKRGGLRVIYYLWLGGAQFWLFTVYDKDEADDLNPAQRKLLRQLLKTELEYRQYKNGALHDQ